MTEWMYFPRSDRCPDVLREVVAVFEAHHQVLDSDRQDGLSSNDVLDVVRPGLESLGFVVETGKKKAEKIHVPVLFGQGGVVEKAFEADAYSADSGVVIEVEAGRAVANNQFLKDLFQACMMQDARHLVIAVRNIYRGGSGSTSGSRDFDRVVKFIDTLYASGRLTLPLEGILILGY